MESGTETGIGYHVLNTGYSPRSADCYLGWLDRRPDGSLYHFYSLTDSPGTELDMEYHMFCTAKRGGLEGPRDDHVSHLSYLRLTSYYIYTLPEIKPSVVSQIIMIILIVFKFIII